MTKKKTIKKKKPCKHEDGLTGEECGTTNGHHDLEEHYKRGDKNVIEAQPQSSEASMWENGYLTFDELKNILEVCNVKDVKIKQDCLTISFVAKNATGKAWKELRERTLRTIGK